MQQPFQSLDDKEMREEVDRERELKSVGRRLVAVNHLNSGIQCQCIDWIWAKQTGYLITRLRHRVKTCQIAVDHGEAFASPWQGVQLVDPRGRSRNQEYPPIWPITEQAFHYATADAARSAGHDAKPARGFGPTFAHRRAHHATLASAFSTWIGSPGAERCLIRHQSPK